MDAHGAAGRDGLGGRVGGLPPLVLAEVLLGLQSRCRNSFRTEPSSLRDVAEAVRDQHVGSLFGLQALTVRAYADLLSTLRLYVTEALSSPEQERLLDVWNLHVFGHGGLRLTGIRQPWLRETGKRWAADEFPLHRGPWVAGYLQNRINSIVELIPLDYPSARTISALLTLRYQVIAPILAGVRSPKLGRKSTGWTLVDRDCEALRIDMQYLFTHLGINATAA